MSRLRQVRLGKRMTKDDLAKASGVSYKQINLIESGKTAPRDSTLFRLADALEVDPLEIDDSEAA